MTTKNKTEPKKGKAEFRALHDKSFVIPEKVKAGLAKVGPDGWEYEIDFLKICGLATTDLANYRDQFSDFWFEVGGRNPKRVWAGSKKLADELRAMT